MDSFLLTLRNSTNYTISVRFLGMEHIMRISRLFNDLFDNVGKIDAYEMEYNFNVFYMREETLKELILNPGLSLAEFDHGVLIELLDFFAFIGATFYIKKLGEELYKIISVIALGKLDEFEKSPGQPFTDFLFIDCYVGVLSTFMALDYDDPSKIQVPHRLKVAISLTCRFRDETSYAPTELFEKINYGNIMVLNQINTSQLQKLSLAYDRWDPFTADISNLEELELYGNYELDDLPSIQNLRTFKWLSTSPNDETYYAENFNKLLSLFPILENIEIEEYKLLETSLPKNIRNLTVRFSHKNSQPSVIKLGHELTSLRLIDRLPERVIFNIHAIPSHNSIKIYFNNIPHEINLFVPPTDSLSIELICSEVNHKLERFNVYKDHFTSYPPDVPKYWKIIVRSNVETELYLPESYETHTGDLKFKSSGPQIIRNGLTCYS